MIHDPSIDPVSSRTTTIGDRDCDFTPLLAITDTEDSRRRSCKSE
jgi:hypothetical protein